MKPILTRRTGWRTRFSGLPVAILFFTALQSIASADEWAQFVDRYLTAYFELHPDQAVKAGRHEFDGRLPDWSPGGLRKTAEFLHRSREEAVRFDKLDDRQQFERDYLTAEIERELFWREKAQWPTKNPIFYTDLGAGLDPNVYVVRNYAPLNVRLRGYIGYAKSLPTAVEQIKRNLRPPLPKTYVDLGRAVLAE
jgi:hypothetical protein